MKRDNVGQVLQLYTSKRGNSTRILEDKIEVDNLGVLTDKFYAKDENRAILLTTVESYELAKHNNIEIDYGSLGENILIDFNPYALAIGSQLKIGTVLFEITQSCTICNHLSSIDKKLPQLLKEDRGIFIRAINSGFIEKGDTISKI